MSGVESWLGQLMSSTPSTRPVNGSRIGVPAQAKICSASTKCSAPTMCTDSPNSRTVPTPLVPTVPSA